MALRFCLFLLFQFKMVLQKAKRDNDPVEGQAVLSENSIAA